MDINGFRMQASRLHLPRKLRQAILEDDLYVFLNPGFSQLDCERLVRLNKKGIQPVIVKPQTVPQPPPLPNLPPGIPTDGKVYIIYNTPPPQPTYDEYEEEGDEDEEEHRHSWVLPLAIVIVMIALVAVLISINPAVIPPAILHLLGG